jgi:hypothetical protein
LAANPFLETNNGKEVTSLGVRSSEEIQAVSPNSYLRTKFLFFFISLLSASAGTGHGSRLAGNSLFGGEFPYGGKAIFD